MKIDALLDTPAILANQAAPVHLAIRFTATEVPGGRDKPVAFAAVVDRSGSMAGRPLQAAKEAAKQVVKNLRSGDFFALVVFDECANTIVPLQPVGDRQVLLNRINGIRDGGSTNLTAGWMLGRDELAKAPEGLQRRLLLLSDGQINVGIVEPAMVRQIVSTGRETNAIRTSCLGFGDGYNEDLMTELAHGTGGAFYDATSPEKLPEIFAAELDGLQNLSVQNLRLRITKLDFCEHLTVLASYPYVLLPDGRWEISVGDLVACEERTLVMLLEVLPLPLMPNGDPVASLEGVSLIELEVVCDLLSVEGVSSMTWRQTVKVLPVQDAAEVKRNREVIPWVAAQRAGKAIADAIKSSDSGNVGEAVERLQREIFDLGRLGDKAGTAEGEALVRDSLQSLQADGAFNVMERKRRNYVAYSMRKMSSTEHWSSPATKPSFKKPRPNRSDDKGSETPPPKA